MAVGALELIIPNIRAQQRMSPLKTKWSNYVGIVSSTPLVFCLSSLALRKSTLSLMNVVLSVSYYLTPQSYYVFLGMLKSMWILNGK